MSVNQRMGLRQAQTLAMTPRLQQAIRLLEMSSQELAVYVEREIEQNPLLERAEAAAEDAGEDRPSTSAIDRPTTDRPRPSGRAPNCGSSGTPFASPRGDAGAGVASTPDEGRAWDPAAPATGMLALSAHLLEQINIDLADQTDRRIGALLVELLDEAGYLSGDLESVAKRIGCTVGRIEATLARLQELDPPGIFARNLKECLAAQLKARNRLDPAMGSLLDHLDLLAAGKRDRLLRACAVDAEALADMIAEIRTLNPKPAEIFTATPAPTVAPDIIVRASDDGGWTVELHPDAVPRLLINERYVTQLRAASPDKTVRAFVSDRLGAANWLVRALHQRTTTILKVASEIVRRQDGFLHRGVEHLKPLTRREVADAIGLHESTVSRATANKYVATPRGLYALRCFFTSALGDSGGGRSHSAEAVRGRIRTLIAGEHEDDVLSDVRLAAMLRAEGITMARRTVTKYRESLRIPSSVRRRRAKALHLR